MPLERLTIRGRETCPATKNKRSMKTMLKWYKENGKYLGFEDDTLLYLVYYEGNGFGWEWEFQYYLIFVPELLLEPLGWHSVL